MSRVTGNAITITNLCGNSAESSCPVADWYPETAYNFSLEKIHME